MESSPQTLHKNFLFSSLLLPPTLGDPQENNKGVRNGLSTITRLPNTWLLSQRYTHWLYPVKALCSNSIPSQVHWERNGLHVSINTSEKHNWCWFVASTRWLISWYSDFLLLFSIILFRSSCFQTAGVHVEKYIFSCFLENHDCFIVCCICSDKS